MMHLSNRIKKMVEQKSEFENRPDNTAFTQQRLPAWQPMLSAGIVIPGFVVIGVAFIGIGVALFVTSRNIDVLEVCRRPSVTKQSQLSCVELLVRCFKKGDKRCINNWLKQQHTPYFLCWSPWFSIVGLHRVDTDLTLFQVLWPGHQELQVQPGVLHFFAF